MASTILSRTISTVVDKRVVLANSQIARPLPFGTSWNSIRIGMRLCVTDTGANIPANGTPRFAIGVCSGTTNLFGDLTTGHFVGLWSAVDPAATWQRYSSPYYYVLSGNPNMSAGKRVGSTLTVGGSYGVAGQTAVLLAQPADGYRGFLFVEIVKGSPWQVRIFRNAGALTDQSQSTFLSLMSSPGMVLSSHDYLPYLNVTVDEATNGALDTLNISHSALVPAVEISDLAVSRLS